MTFWIYNPPEPTGQPTAPGPDLDADYVRGGADSVTRGRCGGCHACPQMWRMEVPLIEGDPYAQYYAGVIYLRRMPLRHLSVPDIGAGDYFEDKCSWAQSHAPPLPDANTYLGPYADQGEAGRGWHLTFESPANEEAHWSLYSPAEAGTIEFEPDAQSRWVCRDIFRCLSANTFERWDNSRPYAFPYPVEDLIITPFYA